MLRQQAGQHRQGLLAADGPRRAHPAARRLRFRTDATCCCVAYRRRRMVSSVAQRRVQRIRAQMFVRSR